MATRQTEQNTPHHRHKEKQLVTISPHARPEGPKQYTVVVWYTTEPRKPEGYPTLKWSATVEADNVEEAMVEGFAAMDIGVDDVLSVEVMELPK